MPLDLGALIEYRDLSLCGLTLEGTRWAGHNDPIGVADRSARNGSA
jgi:hypothetical protein